MTIAFKHDLAGHLRAAGSRPFRFGRHDCTTFTAGWVQRVTGRDVLAAWPYGGLRQGRALLAERGLADLAAAVDTVLVRVPVLSARPGDIAMVRGGLAIVASAGVVVGLRRPAGTEPAPLTEATAAWRVG